MEVKLVNSKASKRPKIVTRRAENLSSGFIVMICVFVGGIFEVIIRPAKMLP